MKSENTRTQDKKAIEAETSVKDIAVAIISTLAYAFMALVVQIVNERASRSSIDFLQIFGNAVAVTLGSLLIVGVFQLGKRFRNQKSRWTIYTRTVWVMIFATILTLLQKFGLI
jgi:hypothetical protein